MQDNKLSQVLGAGYSPFSNYEKIVSYPSAIKLKIIAEGYDTMFSKGVILSASACANYDLRISFLITWTM